MHVLQSPQRGDRMYAVWKFALKGGSARTFSHIAKDTARTFPATAATRNSGLPAAAAGQSFHPSTVSRAWIGPCVVNSREWPGNGVRRETSGVDDAPRGPKHARVRGWTPSCVGNQPLLQRLMKAAEAWHQWRCLPWGPPFQKVSRMARASPRPRCLHGTKDAVWRRRRRRRRSPSPACQGKSKQGANGGAWLGHGHACNSGCPSFVRYGLLCAPGLESSRIRESLRVRSVARRRSGRRRTCTGAYLPGLARRRRCLALPCLALPQLLCCRMNNSYPRPVQDGERASSRPCKDRARLAPCPRRPAGAGGSRLKRLGSTILLGLSQRPCAPNNAIDNGPANAVDHVGCRAQARGRRRQTSARRHNNRTKQQTAR